MSGDPNGVQQFHEFDSEMASLIEMRNSMKKGDEVVQGKDGLLYHDGTVQVDENQVDTATAETYANGKKNVRDGIARYLGSTKRADEIFSKVLPKNAQRRDVGDAFSIQPDSYHERRPNEDHRDRPEEALRDDPAARTGKDDHGASRGTSCRRP